MKMRYVFQLLITFRSIVFVYLIETELTVVTELDPSERYYERMYFRNPQDRLQRKPMETTTHKRALCKHITSSSFFEMTGEETIDPEEFQDELKSRNRTAFDTMYEVARFFCIHCTSQYEYANDYELRSVTVNGDVYKEWLIICPTWQWQPMGTELTLHYVSAEYNVSEALVETDIKIAGRFIFVRHHERLELRALAEEPARPPKNKDVTVEDHYLRVRTYFKPRNNREEDPICKLSRTNRVRMCASALSTPASENKIKFVPRAINVANTCYKNEVTFRIPEVVEIMKQGNNEYKFEEWMIVCQATKIQKRVVPESEMVSDVEVKVEYLISHAYDSNEVFIYSWNEEEFGTVFLENWTTRVNLNLEDWEYNYAI